MTVDAVAATGSSSKLLEGGYVAASPVTRLPAPKAAAVYRRLDEVAGEDSPAEVRLMGSLLVAQLRHALVQPDARGAPDILRSRAAPPGLPRGASCVLDVLSGGGRYRI